MTISRLLAYCLFELEFARIRHLSPCGRGRIASSDAIRVRGYSLSRDLDPSPQPSPTRGEGAHRRWGQMADALTRDEADRVGTRLRRRCVRNYSLRIACSNSNSRGYATSPLVGEVGLHRQMRSG